MNKVKILTWIVIIQAIFCIFFLLFAVVAKQEADMNADLAQRNEQKALEEEKANQKNQREQKRVIDSLEIRLKECDSK
jgi:hypothetical protein